LLRVGFFCVCRPPPPPPPAMTNKPSGGTATQWCVPLIAAELAAANPLVAGTVPTALLSSFLLRQGQHAQVCSSCTIAQQGIGPVLSTVWVWLAACAIRDDSFTQPSYTVISCTLLMRMLWQLSCCCAAAALLCAWQYTCGHGRW
jgi:hypothetical protein